MHAGHYARCFPLVPDEWKPAILWAWNQTMGLTPDGKGEPNVGDTMTAACTLLNYPTDMKAKNPAECMPLAYAATTKGCYIFRNGWQGAGDVVAQAFLKSEGEGGWSHPDGGSLRIYGLGHTWAIQGADNPKAGSRWFENVVMLPEDDINPGTRAVCTYYGSQPDGSGVVSMDMNRIYSGRKMVKDSKGEEKPAGLVDGSLLYRPQNLADLGIRGMRSFAADYSGKSGAPALLALVDKIAGGKKKIWMWQVPDFRQGAGNVKIDANTFTVTQGDASLKATFVAPANVKLEHAKGTKHVHLKDGEFGDKGLNAIHATADGARAGDFFVVMTLQRSTAPEVKVFGSGLGARVNVGRQTLSFDGEKIVLGR